MRNIEDDIIAKIAEEMQKEIDGEILYDFFVGSGWKPITLPKHFGFNQNMIQSIIDWLNHNCEDKWYQCSKIKFCFKNEKDAVMFMLRWS